MTNLSFCIDFIINLKIIHRHYCNIRYILILWKKPVGVWETFSHKKSLFMMIFEKSQRLQWDVVARAPNTPYIWRQWFFFSHSLSSTTNSALAPSKIQIGLVIYFSFIFGSCPIDYFKKKIIYQITNTF
jgi:hypothetical protein